MNEKSNALRLADELGYHDDPRLYAEADDLMAEAAAELRRLHEVNEALITAAMLALVAFKGHWNMDKTARDRAAHDALVAAIAKAKGEEHMRINTGCWVDGCKRFDPNDEEGVEIKCDREWRTLTDAEVDEIAVSGDHEILTFARAIEAKLKEKNT